MARAHAHHRRNQLPDVVSPPQSERAPRGPVSRILYPATSERRAAAIYLVPPLPEGIVRPTRGRQSGPALRPAEASPYLALLRVGFASIPARTGTWCALAAPFHPCLSLALPRGHRRYRLCGTFRRIAAPGRYPAPCPVESGLSSPATPERPPGPLDVFSIRSLSSLAGARLWTPYPACRCPEAAFHRD